MQTSALPKPPRSADLALRPANALMRLERLGAAFATRLSFMRVLLRGLAAERVQVTRPLWAMDAQGYGQAVYSLTYGGHAYSLVAVSNALADHDRSDRVIAEAWDAAFVLYDGVPSAAEVRRIAETAPYQEARRYSARDLTLSRANKSERLFAAVVAALAAGQQPDPARIDQAGYVMRTTAVYGNGKFGIADRDRFSARPGMAAPFQAEMLTVWLIRAFTHDLVEHVAAAQNPATAVKLDRTLKRHLGVGNATGLGMAPFLVSHPALLNAWVWVRETALARVLSSGALSADQRRNARAMAARVQRHLATWHVDDARQMAEIRTLRSEFAQLDFAVPTWRHIWDQVQEASRACQELVQAVLIDLCPDLVDDLADHLTAPDPRTWRPGDRVADLRAQVERSYAWTLTYDFDQRAESALFWYTSEEKLEPRLGHRYEEPGADKERPLDVAWQVQALHRALAAAPAQQKLALFFVEWPALRAIAARVQACCDLPYAEIQDNLIAETTLPIHMLRFKLSMFGANKFDPKSDLWTRITLFQGAPLIDDPDLGADWGFATL